MNFIVYALDATTLIPYVLYLVKNVAEESERNKMFDFLESYIVRRTICKSSNDNYSDLFNEHLIANNILTYLSQFLWIFLHPVGSALLPKYPGSVLPLLQERWSRQKRKRLGKNLTGASVCPSRCWSFPHCCSR